MSDPMERLTSALADRYRIEREIGQGGMATVYLAEDLKHHRQVAVKVLRPELTAIIGSERFLKEIEVTANLQHPNILPLYDSGDADALLYYVMPYVEGESLRRRMDREKQLGVEETVDIAKSVAAALAYAHERGIVHRDIKPENILLQAGQALVADFGIALAVRTAGGTRLTETGLSLGTPHYMSPEQATGDREIDARSDVYSLGAMVYEMLTGDPPHHGNTMQAIIAKILADAPDPIARTRSLVPPNVDAAVQRALAKAPADRFASAADFAAALTNPAFTIPTVAGAQALPGSRPAERTRTMVVGALAALFLLAALWGWLRPTPAPERPVLRYTLTIPMELGLVNDIGTNFALSPDGRRLVYAGAADGPAQLWLRERDQLSANAIPGTERGFHPFFSPDGDRIGFITEDRQLKVVSLRGEPPITLAEGDIRRAGGSWGPDGYIYFVPAGQAGLSRVLASGGPIETVTTLNTQSGEVRHRYPAALPNGRGVLFTIARDQLYERTLTDIAVVDLASREYRTLLQGIMAQWSPTGHLIVVRADGALLAAPFDDDKLEVTGPAVPLLEGVGIEALASADLALSESGTLMYAPGSSSNPYEVAWVSRDGTAEPVDPEWTGLFNFPALSPDGTRLAVSVTEGGETQVWIKQLDRGPLSKLTFEGTRTYRPVWSTDGRQVAFISNRTTSGSDDAYRKRADGSAQAVRVFDTDPAIDEVRYTPDGDWLVFRLGTDNDTTRRDLYMQRVAGDSAPVPLLMTKFNEASPDVSPDGRWLTYTSDESGRYEVYVRPFPNTADAKWQISRNGGTEPLWARSGRELFYRDGNGDMIAAEVVRGPTFVVGAQQVLFSATSFRSAAIHQSYDVTPDGRRFVVVRVRGQNSSTQLIVVENWTTELVEKLR